MSVEDTTTGGPLKGFPTTMWGTILAAGNTLTPESSKHLDRLMKSYWKPVYAFVRTAWKKPVEESKDLTQAFFCHFIEKGLAARAQQDRGSFRGFLKKCLRNFLIDAGRAEAARRPSNPLFSLDALPDELERLAPAAPDEPPDRVYDRTWFQCLFEEVVRATREKLRQEGKELYFEIFRIYCMDPLQPRADSWSASLGAEKHPSAPTYREVAEKMGIAEWDVMNHLKHCRAIMRQILKERIGEYVESEDETERELEGFLRG